MNQLLNQKELILNFNKWFGQNVRKVSAIFSIGVMGSAKVSTLNYAFAPAVDTMRRCPPISYSQLNIHYFYL